MTTTLQGRVFHSLDLGIMPYDIALELQREFVMARIRDYTSDLLLLLEHPPVITTGRFNGREDIKVPLEILRQKGIAIVSTNRGGGATYHGPGQLVGYPIMDLQENRLGIREYIWKLEEVIIRVLDEMGMCGQRINPYPGGVWVGHRKICSIGVHVKRHVTMHGFALNVCNDLRHFADINPCGLDSSVMTSISEVKGDTVMVNQIKRQLINEFARVFSSECFGELKINAVHQTS